MKINCVTVTKGLYVTVDFTFNEHGKIVHKLNEHTHVCTLCKKEVNFPKRWGLIPDLRLSKQIIKFHLVCRKCFSKVRNTIQSLKAGK